MSFQENARDSLQLVGLVLEHIDSVSKRIASTRWNLEIIRRHPEMGVVASPDGQARTVGVDEVKRRLDALVEERGIYENTLVETFDASDIEEVRERFFRLQAAYARWVRLRETAMNVEIGDHDAIKLFAEQDILTAEEREKIISDAKKVAEKAAVGLRLKEASTLISAAGLLR